MNNDFPNAPQPHGQAARATPNPAPAAEGTAGNKGARAFQPATFADKNVRAPFPVAMASGISHQLSTSLPAWLRALYPFEPRAHTTPRGARMSYLDEGPRDTTEAVLMLHGNPTWSFFYRDLIRDLAPAHRCIAPDHIGMGLSEKPENYPYTLATRIADIEALVDALGLTRIHLVVHDWGGAIGFGLATRRPGLVGRIAIMNTAAFPDTHIPGRIALCRGGRLGKFIVRGLNGFAGPATWMAMHRRRLTRDEKRGYLYPYRSWANRVAVHQFVRDIPLEIDHPSRPVLEDIEEKLPLLAGPEHPKLLIWGKRDFCFNKHFLKRWRKIYPDALIVRFKDAGHYLLDDGGEEVRVRIATFLKTPQA
ncbi:alpha/beta fold hydrolase [Termitidicoccus mucosus]